MKHIAFPVRSIQTDGDLKFHITSVVDSNDKVIVPKLMFQDGSYNSLQSAKEVSQFLADALNRSHEGGMDHFCETAPVNPKPVAVEKKHAYAGRR